MIFAIGIAHHWLQRIRHNATDADEHVFQVNSSRCHNAQGQITPRIAQNEGDILKSLAP